MIKYMLVRTNMTWKNIKYQIGCTYKKTKSNEIFDLNYINSAYTINCDQYKIFKIKDNIHCFKILGEINYLEIVPNRNTFKMIAAIKNKDEKILEEFVKSDDDELQTVVINAGVHKYLDILLEEKGIYWASDIIKKYGRNKDLDYFIENTNDFFTLSCIANVGRNKDLDMLMNSTSNLRVIDSVIKNGRKRDIERHILDDYFSINIIKTGIDEYLDFFVTKEIAHHSKLHIINIGRKKDLSLFLKHKDSNLDYEITKHGFDDHLDILIKKDIFLLDSNIMPFQREKDISTFKERYKNFDREEFCLKNK